MQATNGRVSLLALDDDPEEILILRHHLDGIRDQEYELRAFHSPEEALAELRSRRFDLILLDYHLGSRTGIEVFDAMQAMGLNVPAILMTGQGDEELAVQAMHSGLSDYLPKDKLSPRSLRRAISNAIEKFTMRLHLARYREELEAAVCDLRARNEEIQSFYHTLSHELKTPLTAAREFVAIVLDGLQGPLGDEQRRSLEKARECCDQLTRLMNDILDATRLETGKLSIHPEPGSLAELAELALAECQSFAAGREITLEAQAVEGLAPGLFDRQRLLQVLNNLLQNAIKYSRPGGRVTVHVAPEPGGAPFARITVRDTGVGISAGKLAHVFERLYQAHEEDATVHGGLGLGLNLCRELVRLHGGDIGAESSLGKGSAFHFTVPTHVDPKVEERAHEKDTCRRG